jgi:hypothetical protein
MVKSNRYQALISKIFFDGYQPGVPAFGFERIALEHGAETLGIKLPKNLGDVIYSVRFRTALPDDILATQPPGMEWIIEGAALRANKSETIEWLKFTLEGVGERTHGYAFEDTAF